MDKNVIKKYKDVFDWWLDGGRVWVKVTSDKDWFLKHDKDICWGTNALYVQDDEYAEFRKALAEGKDIEYQYKSTVNFSMWFPLQTKDLNSIFTNDRIYRIKPEKPKFSVGDWIKGIYSSEVTQVKENIGYPLDCWKLWQPQENEMIGAYNNEDYIMVQPYKTSLSNAYNHIVPLEFIATLKDK